MPSIEASAASIVERLTGFAEGIPLNALFAGAQVILRHAKELCPVDTGFLRDSGYIENAGDDAVVTFDAHYASYVEFGTRKMDAQPFLRPAIDDNEEEIISAVGAEIVDFMVNELNASPGRANTQGGVPSGTFLEP
jgi:HK97 gp10 family phage protein